MPLRSSSTITEFLSAVTRWAAARPDVTGLALVGSHSRGTATSSSDVDLVLLTSNPQSYLRDTKWLEAFGKVERQQVEHWGKVTSLRAWYEAGLEVEYGIATPEWGASPLDEGTRSLMEAGIRVLFDRDGSLGSAVVG